MLAPPFTTYKDKRKWKPKFCRKPVSENNFSSDDGQSAGPIQYGKKLLHLSSRIIKWCSLCQNSNNSFSVSTNLVYKMYFLKLVQLVFFIVLTAIAV